MTVKHVLDRANHVSLSDSMSLMITLITALLFSLTSPAGAQPVCGPGPGWVQTCSAGIDSMNTGALVGLDLKAYDGTCFRNMNLIMSNPAGTKDIIMRSAPMDVITSSTTPMPSPDCPTPVADGVLDVIETEMLELNLVDGSGTISLRAGSATSGIALNPTFGAIIEDPANTANACSFFDVFFEVTTPCGVLYNHDAFRVVSIITEVPPEGAQYFHPVGLCLDLYPTPPGTPSWPVAQLVDALHQTQEPIIFGCTDPFASNYNPAATVNDGSCCYPVFGPAPFWFPLALAGPPDLDELFTGAEIGISLNPGNCSPTNPDIIAKLTGPTLVNRQPSGLSIQTEIVSMTLQGDGGLFLSAGAGNGLPPSVGEMNEIPGDSFNVESFFDVYVEVTLPGLPPLFNADPFHMTGLIDQLPPGPSLFESTDTNGGPQCIPLFAVPNPGPLDLPFANIVFVNHFIKIIPGCTDPTALNYNPSATFDNGSCFFPADLCMPPDSLWVTNPGEDKALLEWTPLFGATSYTITGASIGGPVVTIDVPAPACQYLATSIPAGTTYWWNVTTNCCLAFGGGTSAPSPNDTFSTDPPCLPPGPISTTLITNTTAQLNWTQSANCTSYTVFGRSSPNGPIVSLLQPGGSSSFTATGLTACTTYDWSVVCNCANGNVSDIATPIQTFTTTGCPAKTELEIGNRLTTMIHPNPATDQLMIIWNGDEADVEVYDIRGRMIAAHRSVTGNNFTMSTSGLSNGIYQVMISSGGDINVEKLIIAR